MNNPLLAQLQSSALIVRRTVAPTVNRRDSKRHPPTPRKLRLSPTAARAIFVFFASFFVVANLGLAWCWFNLDTVRLWASTLVGG
jgi:hypothetical protein